MISEEQFDNYIFVDGQLLFLNCNYDLSQINVQIKVRKKVGKSLEVCLINLKFDGAVELDLLDSFSTAGNYSDIVIGKLESGQYYISFNPYGNSGEPNERDNFIIKADHCLVTELKSQA